VQHNYLSTREEILYMVKGNIKKPVTFNVPYLDTKRGYAGYNAKYPAKSEFYRRNNVWTDITEIFSGKVHPTQKPLQVFEIPILTNTNEGDWLMDPFAGSMTAAHAARNLGRNWICVEKDETIFDSAVEAMNSTKRKR
jgi:DNA modification methylase